MPKTKTQKEQTIQSLSQDLQNQNAIAVVDFTGLTVHALTDLRNQIRQQNAKMQVVKKTLLQRALESAGIAFPVSGMEGELAAVFAFGDPVAPIKILSTFAKTSEQLQLRGGYLSGAVLDVTELKQLADLPSVEIVRGQLVGMLAAPISGFANVLYGNMKGLVYALQAIRDNK